MRARLVVFPIRGRNWCFSRSIDPSALESESSEIPKTFKDLWKKIIIFSSNSNPNHSNVELLADFVSNKMDRAWTGLGKASPGSFKNKLHGLGLRILARVKPSEFFLKSVSKEVTKVEVTYPASLNPRVVRRRLRHIALRGTAVHKRYFYVSVSLIPLTSVFMVLPTPNILFFWVSFRSYSHWRALQGSERLLQLVSDSSYIDNLSVSGNKTKTAHNSSEDGIRSSVGLQWVLKASDELENLIHLEDAPDGLSKCSIADICKTFNLNTTEVLKYRDSM